MRVSSDLSFFLWRKKRGFLCQRQSGESRILLALRAFGVRERREEREVERVRNEREILSFLAKLSSSVRV